MSSMSIPYVPKNSSRPARSFHAVEFLIKSAPALSIAFMAYVTLQGLHW
jgi:hypothetical protein